MYNKTSKSSLTREIDVELNINSENDDLLIIIKGAITIRADPCSGGASALRARGVR